MPSIKSRMYILSFRSDDPRNVDTLPSGVSYLVHGREVGSHRHGLIVLEHLNTPNRVIQLLKPMGFEKVKVHTVPSQGMRLAYWINLCKKDDPVEIGRHPTFSSRPDGHWEDWKSQYTPDY